MGLIRNRIRPLNIKREPMGSLFIYYILSSYPYWLRLAFLASRFSFNISKIEPPIQ